MSSDDRDSDKTSSHNSPETRNAPQMETKSHARMMSGSTGFILQVKEAGGTPSVGADFQTFILSIGSSALYHMGDAALPDGTKGQINLPMAQLNIEVLGMLEDKTRGNLTPDEEKLLSNLLCDLRVRYVDTLKKSKDDT